MAHEQVNTQRTPAISLDTGIDIFGRSPFACRDNRMILASDAGDTPMLIYCSTIDATEGRIDKVIGQFGSIKRHLRSGGSTHQRHDDGRPGKRSPPAMHGRSSKVGAELLYMLPTSRSTEDGGKMHRILLGGPFSRYRIIITEPAILPHQAGLDGELVGDPLPPSSFGSK